MEMKEIVAKHKIVGIISNYKINLKNFFVKKLNINNPEMALKMVGLDNTYLDKKTIDLSLSEKLKVDLATKLNKDIIIVGDLSNSLIYKELEFIKKLLLKLSNEYNKKIVVIDNDVNSFINLVKHIYVLENKEIIYDTNDYFDKKLYEYTKKPEIVDFIEYVNKDSERVDLTLDIYELIKDIFRRVS